MPTKLKNIAVVSLSTVGSRVLGLLRDILIFAALGASLWNSAFILAFTLPNLFRRLLGEGALTSAIVPVFSDVMEREGRERAFDFFNQVIVRLSIVLCILVTGGMCLLGFLAHSGWLSERWALGSELAVVLLPYMIFICLAAIVSAGLNLVGRFAVAACTPILLNLAMIGAVAAGLFLEAETAQLVYWLCGGVLFGGLLQLLAPAWDLSRQGWRPRLKVKANAAMGELWRLFLPGLMGAAILQVNILVSRLLAFTLDDSSVSVLYLASRLMELPLGIFTVAVVTVFFPLMARALSAQDADGFAKVFLQGMRLVVGISVPAGVGLCVLGEPILGLLFQWGAFDQTDVIATIPLIAIYGIGLPFYSAATFATRGLHAGKDMKTPVRVAGLCLAVNAVSGIILMQFFGASGLAAANVLAALVQAVVLWRALSKQRPDISFSRLRPAILKVIGAGLLMGVFCALGLAFFNQFEWSEKLHAGLTVGTLVPAGAAFYFGLLYLFKFEELQEMWALVRRVLPGDR
ncbi:MAG: murein biosynthesis integral membrane protein MurJ [Opitutales bacterium]|jgi:putative peptidoglycan lipid II flippase|nr:murein biosynthesis integral membrane protein MurJ [Opitutales bacterium]MDP4643659.1 murein biosynthesis integral membrane protein MurJ [Opitutales bacterium]MDP4777502.1 murein biosynthesis integral membrane protein MurJ [Opitutales bacterium]MDP4884218.1 murein biosynthesis integral membrane protein MurJ [Opitutales bacterium]MDP5079559.1 murein biosynthesis integral membrane protein MurJ [Opitutales bacterium]